LFHYAFQYASNKTDSLPTKSPTKEKNTPKATPSTSLDTVDLTEPHGNDDVQSVEHMDCETPVTKGKAKMKRSSSVDLDKEQETINKVNNLYFYINKIY
jgi:hypothetical protein